VHADVHGVVISPAVRQLRRSTSPVNHLDDYHFALLSMPPAPRQDALIAVRHTAVKPQGFEL